MAHTLMDNLPRRVRTGACRDQRASHHEYLCIQASPSNVDAIPNRYNPLINFFPNIYAVSDLHIYKNKTTNSYPSGDFELS
jgi:hypothetical protein